MPTWKITSGAHSGSEYSGSTFTNEEGKHVRNEQAREVSRRIAEDRHRGQVLEIAKTKRNLPPKERSISLSTESDVTEEEVQELQKRLDNLCSKPLKDAKPPVSPDLVVMKVKLLKTEEIVTVEDDNLHSLVEISEDIRKGDWVQLRLLSDFTAVWEKVPETVVKQWEKELLMEKLAESMPPDQVAKSRGNAAFKRGDYEMADRYYSQAIKSNSKLAVYYCNRALCRIKQRRFKEAREDCSAALDIDSSNIKALLRRGHCHLEEGMMSMAIKDFEAVLAREPTNIDARAGIQEVEKKKREALLVGQKESTTLFPELL